MTRAVAGRGCAAVAEIRRIRVAACHSSDQRVLSRARRTRQEDPRLVASLTPIDLQRMRDQLFFEGVEHNRRLSRFWLLLPLSAVIASAGVVSDSTATVI